MPDERDRQIEDLERRLRWTQEDLERAWKLVDDVVAKLRNQADAAKAHAELLAQRKAVEERGEIFRPH
jgi:hypothetical protein